jgi:hypothetical protein
MLKVVAELIMNRKKDFVFQAPKLKTLEVH